MKICKYCKWFVKSYSVCVNGDSDKCADFVSDDDTCEEHEEDQKWVEEK